MLLRQSPFRGENEDKIYDAILSEEPVFPGHVLKDDVSLIQQLLVREPEQRLGSGPEDALEVMRHPFFKKINWDHLYHKRILVPFVPKIQSATDVSNFDNEFTSVTPLLTPVQSGESSNTWRKLHLNHSTTNAPLFLSPYQNNARRVSRILSILTAMTREPFSEASQASIHIGAAI